MVPRYLEFDMECFIEAARLKAPPPPGKSNRHSIYNGQTFVLAHQGWIPNEAETDNCVMLALFLVNFSICVGWNLRL